MKRAGVPNRVEAVRQQSNVFMFELPARIYLSQSSDTRDILSASPFFGGGIFIMSVFLNSFFSIYHPPDLRLNK